MAKKKVSQIVEEILEGFLPENGYELYNVEFVKEGKDWFLRVYIDVAEAGAAARPGIEWARQGIGTDDCEKVSRFLSEELDRLDPVEQNYYLEVSSPGLDRELIKDRDFQRFAGDQVRVRLYQAYEGSKSLEGKLLGIVGNDLVIERGGENVALPREKVAKVTLEVVF